MKLKSLIKSSKKPPVMPEGERLSIHILPTSATMVGVCLTGISLVKIIEQHNGPSNVDEVLALVSILFCISTLFSYRSIRLQGKPVAAKLERWADAVFSVGMICMVIVSILFAFDLV